MKKMTVLALSVMMFVLCAIPSLAADFDLSVFNLRDYTFEEREDGGGYFIYPNYYFKGSRIRKITESDFSIQRYYSSIEPYISYAVTEGKSDKTVFYLKLIVCQENGKMLTDRVTFKIGNRIYSFALQEDDDDLEYTDGVYFEWIQIPIARDGITFLYDWLAAEEPITGVIYGTKGEVLHFTVPDVMKTMIGDMFICFREAGGIDYMYEKAYGITLID